MKTPVANPFPIIDHRMQIGGRAVSDWAAEIGTPCFLYDASRVRQRIVALRDALPNSVRLHYAIKANPLPSLVKLLSERLDGLDIASQGELELAMTSIDAARRERISFAGPGKTRKELEAAIHAGVVLHLESLEQIRLANEISEALHCRAKVALRINPDFRIKASGMQMGGGPQVFGIDAEQVDDAFLALRNSALEFIGLHIFAGSQNLNTESLCQAQQQTFELAVRLAPRAPGTIRHLNIGGGFGIPYFAGDTALDLGRIGDNLKGLIAQHRAALPEAGIILELGRYLVGEAGIYVSRVIDKKTSRGQLYLITDGGMHHHLAASGNLGQAIPRNFPIRIADRADCAATQTTTVCGCLCTPIDTLARACELPDAEIGDLIVVLQSGAYARSASPGGFLSHPAAAEKLV